MSAACQWCREPFIQRPRPPEHVNALRAVLFVTDAAYTPVICDGCFARVLGTAPPIEHVMRPAGLLNL